jgi:CRISPR system Cascade subunit CasA
MATPVPRTAPLRLVDASYDLRRKPWILCEFLDGSVAKLGIEEVLVNAHKIAAVHHASPVVTVAIDRMLLAISQRVFLPTSAQQWRALWDTPHFDPKAIVSYFEKHHDRFDLFHEVYPFLQVPRLDEALERPKGKSLETPAFRLAPEQSQYGGAAYFFARLPDEPSIKPDEAACALLAFQGFTAGGRIQNDAVARKAGILRGGAPVLLRGRTLRETLLWNLTWHADRKTTDVPPWERRIPQRANRAPEGPIDMLVWPSRRVMLVPVRDAAGKVVVRDVITAAGEDMGPPGPSRRKGRGDYADPQFAYRKEDEDAKSPEAIVVKMSPTRATWRDALAIFDPETGEPGFRQPLAIAQVAALLREESATKDLPKDLPMPTGVDVFGLVSSKSKNLDARVDSLPLPLPLLVDAAKVAILRTALAEAENLANALRNRVLYALAVTLIVDPDKSAIKALRENLGTIPAYWEILGSQFNGWLTALGQGQGGQESNAASLWAWRGLLREAANKVALRAVEDIGLAGRAIRAGVAAERVLANVLAEIVPLPEGAATPEGLPLPKHDLPPWSDTTDFIPAIEKLVQNKHLGALAALRTSLAVPDRVSVEARAIVEPLLPRVTNVPGLPTGGPGRHTRRSYYLVAALYAVHRESTKGVSLGTAMRRVALGCHHDPTAESSATTERFEAILATHQDDVGELVAAALPLVYEHGKLDWELLLHDLLFWGRRDRLIQRAWARDFYQGPALQTAAPAEDDDSAEDDDDDEDEEAL